MTKTLLCAVGVVALMAGCSASATNYQEAAEKLIGSELSDQLAMSSLDGHCEEPSSNDVGTTFSCTATSADGETIRFEAEIKPDEKVFVTTTNVLSAERLAQIEAEAARILTEQVGQDLPAENIDCGDTAIVAESGAPFVCALTDPSSSEVYDAKITLDDVESPTRLDVEVSDTPRA